MNRSHIPRSVTLDEELLQIAAQHFANYYDGGAYDPLDPPSPDPLRKAIEAYLRYEKVSQRS